MRQAPPTAWRHRDQPVTSRNYSKYKVDDVSGVRARFCANNSPFTMTNHKIQVRNRYWSVFKYTVRAMWEMCRNLRPTWGEKSEKVWAWLEIMQVCAWLVCEAEDKWADNCCIFILFLFLLPVCGLALWPPRQLHVLQSFQIHTPWQTADIVLGRVLLRQDLGGGRHRVRRRGSVTVGGSLFRTDPRLAQDLLPSGEHAGRKMRGTRRGKSDFCAGYFW